jgi:hypothetical protein
LVEDIHASLKEFKRKYYAYVLAIYGIIMILLDTCLVYINGLNLWFSLALGIFFFTIGIGFFLAVPLLSGTTTRSRDRASIDNVVKMPVFLIIGCQVISSLYLTSSLLTLTESTYSETIKCAGTGFFAFFTSIVFAQKAIGKRVTFSALLALVSLTPFLFTNRLIGFVWIIFLAFIVILILTTKKRKAADI